MVSSVTLFSCYKIAANQFYCNTKKSRDGGGTAIRSDSKVMHQKKNPEAPN